MKKPELPSSSTLNNVIGLSTRRIDVQTLFDAIRPHTYPPSISHTVYTPRYFSLIQNRARGKSQGKGRFRGIIPVIPDSSPQSDYVCNVRLQGLRKLYLNLVAAPLIFDPLSRKRRDEDGIRSRRSLDPFTEPDLDGRIGINKSRALCWSRTNDFWWYPILGSPRRKPLLRTSKENKSHYADCNFNTSQSEDHSNQNITKPFQCTMKITKMQRIFP